MFDLSKLGVGEWFPYQDSIVNKDGEVEWLPLDPNSKEKVCFVQPDSYDLRIATEKYRGRKINIPVKDPDTRQMNVVPTYEQTPEQAREEGMEFWDRAITAWEIFDPSGNLIPCTRENKYKLIMGHMPFLRFSNRSLQMLQGLKADTKEKETKNSLTGSTNATSK